MRTGRKYLSASRGGHVGGDEHISPGASSERRLIEQIELSEHIGSEVENGPHGDVFRIEETVKLADGISHIFKRGRADSHHSDAVISMRTLSASSTVTPDAPQASMTAPAVLDRLGSNSVDLFTPERTASPRPIITPHDSTTSAGPSTGPRPQTSSQLSFPSRLGRSPSNRRPTRLLSSASKEQRRRTLARSSSDPRTFGTITSPINHPRSVIERTFSDATSSTERSDGGRKTSIERLEEGGRGYLA